MEILADADYQSTGVQTGGRAVTPPHRKSKKNAPAWHEERQRSPAQGVLFTAHPRRAWHRALEELEGSWPSRAHK
ncbi:hypothetical protein [Streptomyces chartreusis]|uniref:hypothetical protein n=1 Tax=Streptomyces chartreusis TaxID=1969 RepID=UPI00363B0CD9